MGDVLYRENSMERMLRRQEERSAEFVPILSHEGALVRPWGNAIQCLSCAMVCPYDPKFGYFASQDGSHVYTGENDRPDAELWTRQAPLPKPRVNVVTAPKLEEPDPEPDMAAVKARVAAQDVALRAAAALEPDSPIRAMTRAEREAQRPPAVRGYIDRARKKGPERSKLASRSREARRLEKQRERARRRGQDPALTPTEERALRSAARKLGINPTELTEATAALREDV